MKKNKSNLWMEFKKFISRGNIIDMSIGVIIGGAFGAIVTAFTKILLTLATWGVDGGLSGLITILPGLNASQAAPDGLLNTYTSSEFADLVYTGKEALYTQYGGTFVFNHLPVLDWGAFINAILSFLIIALVLFTILKIFNYVGKKRKEFEAAQLEEYYVKNPSERPAPVVPGKPLPTELELLTQIRDSLVTPKAAPKATTKKTIK